MTKNQKIILGSISAALLISISGYFLYKEIRFNSLIEQSEAAIQRKDYQSALMAAKAASDMNAIKAENVFLLSDKLVKSDESFRQATQVESEQKFEEADALFQAVITEDLKNYDSAQKKIPVVRERWSQLRLKKAQELFQKQQYEKAYQKLSELLSKNKLYQPAQKLKGEYQKKAEQQRLEREQKNLNDLFTKISSYNIVPAREKLNAYLAEDHPEPLKKQAQNKINYLNNEEKLVAKSVESLRSENYYSEAISLVRKTMMMDLAAKEKLIPELEAEKAAYIKEMEEKKEKEDTLAINIGKQVLLENLRSPSSATINNESILDRDSYGRRLIYFSVDAQNAFGAYLRNYFLVVIRPNLSGQNGFYNSVFAVQSCSADPHNFEISATKSMNSWNESP